MDKTEIYLEAERLREAFSLIKNFYKNWEKNIWIYRRVQQQHDLVEIPLQPQQTVAEIGKLGKGLRAVRREASAHFRCIRPVDFDPGYHWSRFRRKGWT